MSAPVQMGKPQSSKKAPLPTCLADVMEAAAIVFAHCWTDTTKDHVRRAGKTYLRGLKKLQVAVDAGNAGQIRRRSFHVEHSLAGRFCCLLMAYAKRNRNLTLDAAKTRAAMVSLRKPSGESVRAKAIQKPDGGARHICIFGLMDVAANRLGTDILQVVWGASSYEFARKGLGRDAAIRNALHSMNEGGVRRFVRSDLKDFYPSVDKEEVTKLIPLPQAIIRNTFLIAHTKEMNSDYHDVDSETTVRAGLPQGSRSSALIASKLIESLIDGLPGASLAMSYGDDILVGVTTDSKAESVKNTLASRSAKHPAGPFKLKMLEVIKLGTPNDYLGYMFRHRAAHYGGGARVSASRKAILRFKRRVARKLIFIPFGNQLDVAEIEIRKWVRSYGAWGGGESAVLIGWLDLTHMVLRIVKSFRAYVKVRKLTFKSLTDVTALFDAKFLTYIH